jgi:predicted nucleic acid-binding protein
MCLVIDTCCWHAVFDVTNSSHRKFQPVLQWVRFGRGRVVYGGSTYRQEIRNSSKIRSLLTELTRAGRTVVIPDEDVDAEERRVKRMESCADFDDAHLIAIVAVSGCRIVCTADRAAQRYLKQGRFYSGVARKPKIYCDSAHRTLLKNANIASICGR